jgi:cytochrome c peroxidase
MKIRRLFGFVLATIFLYAACKKDPSSPSDPDPEPIDTSMVEMIPYELVYNLHFPKPEPIPEDNQMFYERIWLGRKLFYDERLSNTGESCASCHFQSQGFAMDGVSEADKGLTSLPLVNLAWNKNFMWSGRIFGTLEDVMYVEVTERFHTDMEKINAIEEYRLMFRKYYGVKTITEHDLAKALAQFLRTLISKNTKFDRVLLGQEVLSPQEELGRQLYFGERGDCFHCHTILFTSDNALHVNGLDAEYNKEIDYGYYNVSKNPEDKGRFRTPNLRNIALKNTFMHDGRFSTLREVVEFYNSKVNLVPNIDPVMLKPNRVDGKLNLEEYEIDALVAFLHTFTDYDMIADTAFSNPNF